MEWTEEAIAQLRAFWAEGHSTAEIGRRMSVSKNAIVGKAHRLNLTARPSPIRRTEQGAREATPRRVSGPTLPAFGEAAAQAAPRLVHGAGCHEEGGRPEGREPESRGSAAPRPAPVARPASPRISPCCWPIGEPGTPSFRFCDAGAVQGKPYCAEHVQLAYVRVRERREDAA